MDSKRMQPIPVSEKKKRQRDETYMTVEKTRKKARTDALELKRASEGIGVSHGGSRSQKFMFNDRMSFKEFSAISERARGNKLAALHHDQPTLIEGKDDSGERIKQNMRWLSTFIKEYCGIDIEVQCYYDEETNIIHAAANTFADLRKMREKLDVRKAQEILDIVRGNPAFVAELGGRSERHVKKFGKRGFTDEIEEAEETGFEIVPNSTGKDGLHAERRIQKHLAGGAGESVDDFHLDPSRLGGLRRPCTICFHCILSEEDRRTEHSGPLWPSISSVLELTTKQFGDTSREILSRKHRSYATLMKDKKTVSVDDDSESESDYEGDDEEEE